MKKIILTSTLAAASLVQIASAQLIIDVFAGTDPSSSTPWTSAGVVEDLSSAAGATINGGGVVNVTGGLTLTRTGASNGGFNGGAFGNDMLDDYNFVGGGATQTITIGNFDTAGTANVIETNANLGSLIGNSFTLEAATTYRLYLFGIGDNDGQNTTFTFDGVAKTTSPLLSDPTHFVTFDFTTASIAGFELEFSYANPSGGNGIFNGLALVAIPEPSAYALIFGLTALTAITLRRRKA